MVQLSDRSKLELGSFPATATTSRALPERLTPHLQRLIDAGSDAITAQFRSSGKDDGELGWTFEDVDPLGEESRYSPLKGIVHKYRNRVLWKVSYRCAAHCQFCTRIRQIGSSDGDLSSNDVDAAVAYIRNHRDVDDIILSGGDPLYTPHVTGGIIHELSKIDTVKVIRIGTRLPVHAPTSFRAPALEEILNTIAEVAAKKAVYVQIQFNHPAELTEDTKAAIHLLKRTGASLLAQTVFLRDINDNEETLSLLFRELFYLGIVPYYIFRCDYVKGLERFVCDIDRERIIMTNITKKLSGISVPTYVIDVPGRGKIPVPLYFWSDISLEECKDYDGNIISLMESKNCDPERLKGRGGARSSKLQSIAT